METVTGALAVAVPIWRHLHAEIEKELSDPDHLRLELNILSKSDQRGSIAG